MAVTFTLTSPVVNDPHLGPSWATTHFDTLQTSFERFAGTLFGVWAGAWDDVVALALAAGVVIAAWPSTRRATAEDARTRGLSLVLILAALALYFATPNEVSFAIAHIHIRFPIFAALLVPALLPAPTGRRGLAALVVFNVAAVTSGVYATLESIAFQTEVGGFDSVLAAAAPGKRMLGLIYDPASRFVTTLPPFLHFHAYYRARAGGVAEVSWVSSLAHMPIRYLPGAAPPHVPDLSEWHPEDFDNVRSGPYYDYVLTRGSESLFLAATEEGPRWRKVAADPPWALWARDEAGAE
jgi:hypothetical protein